MRRRDFLFGGLATLGTARLVAAQERRMPRIGLMLAAPIEGPFAQAFRQGLRELGYVEGKNIHVEYRSAEGSPDRFASIAAELVRLQMDLIVAGGGGASARAAMQATRSIPIVFPAAADPVLEGLVQTLARPGGNATGLSIISSEINAKRLQVLKELLPKLGRVGFLTDPKMGGIVEESAITATRSAALALSLQLEVIRASSPEEFAPAFDSARKARTEALIVSASSTFNAHRRPLVELAERQRLVTLWEHRQFPLAGGLLSYGPDIADLYRSAARFVDRVLKGAKPGDLPVEQATKLELVINLKAAKALGLKIPPRVLVRADQVIE
jgi:putative tryptophan/tyrosine transport system substrate-binding protein